MSKCKLYIKAGADNTYIGEFPSRKAAEKYHNLIKTDIQQRYGYKVKAEPVYVEQGKPKK